MAATPKRVNPLIKRNQQRQQRRTPTPRTAARPDYYGPRAPRVNAPKATAPQPAQKTAPRPVSRPTPNMDRYPMKSTPPPGVSYVRVPWQDVWKGKIAPPMNRPVGLPQGQKWETPGQLVETNGGRYYVPETGPELREPKRTWVPPDYQPTYWEDPHRVARWHNAIQSMPPGWEAPEWLDVDSVNAAYEYMKYTNNDLPWYSWKWLSPTDPGREFLKGLSAPPPEMLWQGEENFGLEHQIPTPYMQQQMQAQQAAGVAEYEPQQEIGDPSQGGMTDEQWDALPGWQRTMINILNSPVTAGAMGGLPGAMIGLGVGGPIGALVGGAIGAGAGVYSQKNPESSIAQAMMLLDYPRAWLEQGLGTLGQITGAATTPGGKYGNVQDILNNLPSAWQAARLTYEVQGAPFNLIPEWVTGVKLKPGETWQLGNPNPVQTGYTGDVDLDALTEARERIIAGEAPEAVYQDISAKMGISGQWRDLMSGFILDPLNAVPGLTKAGGRTLGKLTGNERLALAFDTSRGLTEAVKTYGNLLRKAPIEEVSKMDSFSKFLGGLDKQGNVRYLVNPQEKGGIFNYLTHLTPAARASEVINNSGIEMAVLLERAGDNPGEMVRLIHSVANTPDDLARELSMQSLKSADAAAIPMALKDFGTKADEHLAAWEASRWQRTVVENIAKVTGKRAEKVIQELNQGDPELLLKQFIEKAKTMEGDAAKALIADYEAGELTGLKLQSIVKGFAKDNVPYTADMFRANLYADLMEHTADWGAKWFGVKPDPTWLRLANTVKSAQSMLLLGLNPNYMVNNALNNMVTMAFDGVLGTRTTRQIEDIWTRALGGTQPARLKSKALPFDLGESTSAPIRAAQQMPGTLTDIQDFFRTKTKKFQVFGNLSGEIEGLSSQQAYTSGFVQAWNRMWKRGTGYERMPAALEQQLNAIDPNLTELVYGAIHGGMNKAEIEKALWSGVIKRNAGSAVPEIIRRTGMSEADVNEALTHAGMFEPEFADLLSNAKGNDEIINLINQRELKVQDYLDKITADNLEGEAARIAGAVKSEGLQGVLKIYDDMSYSDSREWMEHTAHMTHMMETAADMEPGERNAYIRGEQQKARQEWARTNVRRKNQYLAISNGLGLDSETGRRITGYLTEHEDNWKGFYKYRDEVMDRYFNTEFDTREQRLAAWDALQDDLNRRYKDAGQKRNEIQTRMDKEFVDLFAAQYGEEAGKTAAKWRKGIRDINERMEREMFGFRDSIRKLPKEEKRLAWLDFNQKSRYRDMADLYTENMKGAMEVYEYLTGKRPSGAGAATPPEPPPQIPSAPIRMKVTDRTKQLRTRINDLRLEGGTDWVDQMITTLKEARLDDGELKHLMQKENQEALTQELPISAVTEKGAADPAAAVMIERYPGIGRQKPKAEAPAEVPTTAAFEEKAAANAKLNQDLAEVNRIAQENGLETRASILAFVHKYGRNEGKRANYVEDITPEVMRRAVEDKIAAETAEATVPAAPAPMPEIELTNAQKHANQIRNMVNEGDYNSALSNTRKVTDPATRAAIYEAVPELKAAVEKGDELQAAIFANNLDAVPPEVVEALTARYHTLGMEAEIGEAGWKHMIDKEEWVSQKSTYPEWYTDIYKGASYDGKHGKEAVVQAARDLSTRQVKTKAGGANYRVVDDLIAEATASLEVDNPAYRKAMGYQFDFDVWEDELYKLTEIARTSDNPETLSNLLYENVANKLAELPDDAPSLYSDRVINLQEYINGKLEPDIDEHPMTPDVQQMESGKVSQAGWGEDVKQFAPDADVQAEAITPEIHMAQVRRDLRAAFIERFLSGQEEVLSGAWSAEAQADALLGILDARARVWAKKTGRTSAEWYATRIEGVGDTPEDVNKLLQTMPAAPKGAVDFTADGRAVIYALQSPDVTTLVHEIGHIFRRDLEDTDLDAAAKWGGLTGAAEMRRLELDVMNNIVDPRDADYQRWSRAEEKFAYGFERYLKDGIAPTPELGRLFEQFKDWISQIYARLRSRMVDDISPEMRGVYDRLLAESDAGDYPIQTETGRARVQNPNAYIRELLNTTTEEQAAKIMQEGLGTTPKETGGTLFQRPAEAQAIIERFEITDKLTNRSWIEPNGVIRDAVNEHNPLAGIVPMDRYLEAGLIRSWYNKDTGLMLEFRRPLTKQQIKALEPYLSGDVLLDYGKGYFDFRNPLKGTDEALEEINKANQYLSQRRGTLFQATFEDGRTVPIPDEQQPAPALNMLGSTDTIQPTPPLDRMQEEGWKQWEPIFDEMKGYFTNKERQTPGSVLNQVMDEDTARSLKAYLGKVYGQMADTKLAAIKQGEMKRDMSLLNYSQRTGFDNVLGAVLPYSFWTTRSAVNWGLRAIDRPALMANYARIRNFQNNVVNTKGFPSRLKNKMKIPMPFLPDWAGDGIYIDPFKQLFPFENITRPFEMWQQQRTQEQRRAETILQMWVEDDQVNATEAQQAIETQQGDLWERAVAQAKLDTEGEISNPLDFAFLMSGPSLPVGWLYNVAKGTPEKIGQLPVTRMIQSATALMGANKGRGVNIEGPLRRMMGLPERDWLQDYRVERMLANMTAEGKLTSQEAIQAMIDKTGPYYQEAEARVAKSGAVSFFGGFTGADLFPEGEAEQRGLKNEYDTAIAAYEAGQTDALTQFWDAHPEYEARRAMGQDPEKRMRQFLISQVWDGWNQAPDLTRRDLSEGLGNLFQDNFLNKETRSYDTIDTDTLAMWAKVMGGTVPEAAGNVPTLPLQETDPAIVQAYQDYQDQKEQTFPGISRIEKIYYGIPEGTARERWAEQHPELDEYQQWKNAYFAEHPEIIQYAIGEDNKVAGQKPEIQARYYQYQAQRDSYFPGVYDKQDEYFSLPEGAARKAYLAENPDLADYWDWRKQYMAQHPEMIPYLMSTESLASKVLGEDYQTQAQMINAQVPDYTQEYNSQDYMSQDYLSDQELAEFTPALIRQVMGHFYANQSLGSGAQKELRRIYNQSGRQMSFDEWISVVIKNTFGLQRENILQ